MQEHIIYRRYCINLALVSCVIACFVAAINLLVDPYDIFGSKRISGFNALKPAATERIRVFKPYQVERYSPRIVIGGNSRPEMGIDPESNCWESIDQPIYNMGIPGASFYLQSLYSLHGVVSGHGNRILMGIDFYDFLIDAKQSHRPTRDETELTQNELRLAPEITGASFFSHYRQRATDHLTSLFSLNTFFDSIRTILQQRSSNVATRNENGFNPFHEFNYILNSEGQWVLFEQKNKELEIMFKKPDLAIRYTDGTLSRDFDDLRRFLELSNSKNIEVTLFINPYHINYLEHILDSGLWSDFEAWKQQILKIAETYHVALWDFNTADQYATEIPPSRGVLNEKLQWFVEPAHYNSKLGNLMLSSLLNKACDHSDFPGTFGKLLQPDTMETHLRRLRESVISGVK